MPIVGVQSVIYGVDDLPTCEKFFTDFQANETSWPAAPSAPLMRLALGVP